MNVHVQEPMQTAGRITTARIHVHHETRAPEPLNAVSVFQLKRARTIAVAIAIIGKNTSRGWVPGGKFHVLARVIATLLQMAARFAGRRILAKYNSRSGIRHHEEDVLGAFIAG